MNIRLVFNRKKFNITYSAFLISACVFKMAIGSFFAFDLIYFFYFFVLTNIIFLSKIKTSLLNKTPFFWFAVIDFLLVILFNFEKVINLKIIIGDIFNILWWAIFMFIVDSTINTFEDYKNFEKKAFLFTFLFVIVASLMGAFKLYSISHGQIKKSYYTMEGVLIPGTSLWSDYTVFASALTLGIISGKYLFDKSDKKTTKILIVISQIFIMTIVFFSNSRRGVLFIVLMLIMIILYSFNQGNVRNVKIKSLSYLLISVLILLFLFGGKLKSIVNTDPSQGVLTRISTLDDVSELTSSRTIRVKYATDLISQFNWRELAFGDGFNYLEQYSAKFHTDIGSDYPHNFILSTFLYGGITAVFLIIFLIAYTIYAYIKRFSIFSGFSFWFLILLMFSLTSTNTWFSINLNIILSLLPFLTFKEKRIFSLPAMEL